ncbi:MAG: glycine--tRNA ligase [Dehalococcoidales bacterium]|jgi:glycyl-tRNA synthetase|nr:glycine--tRNA ligase [Dehalococcoidales bacterium]MDP7285647.1 glycine--tRNA ligase [Dehalococcoidales bacterium]MDP7416019.1 glycine--tRNA ligase [Dehalococcoidales bacterium]
MAEAASGKVNMEKMVSLCQRRGFIFPSSEIYGGLSSCWDYGPLGVALKQNIKQAWWHAVVQERDDIVGLDTSILMHPRVWSASGHLEQFTDPLVECKSCHLRWRADELKANGCPSCGGELTEPHMFHLMFKTFMGPVEEEANVVYLRPETAQGIFVNFQNVLNTTRKRLPFGIAQMGKSFRNEITTGNFIFRSREFEQMEIEFFIKPGTDGEWFDYWLEERRRWYEKSGIRQENLRLREHTSSELAHYALKCYDIEYQFPMGWSELEGVANRGDFDLKQHTSHSGKGLTYLDEETNQHIVPYIIEPSAGVDRSVLAFLCDAYDEEPDKDEIRTILHLHPSLAPIKVAVLPLSRKENLAKVAREVYADLRPCWMVQYDDTQSIGRRYRRQDEIGTPFCVTVDFQSLEDNQVTVRERDSMNQIRIPIAELEKTLAAKLKGEPLSVLPPGGQIWKKQEG